MASSTSTSSTYLRGHNKRVLHKDDMPLDNNNIFNENGEQISTYNNPGTPEQQAPLVSQSNEKQIYNNNKSTWDLGNLSPSILFAEAAVVTLIVGTLYCVIVLLL